MICMIKPVIFLASLDIKDVFYSVSIYKEHLKFPRFLVKGKPLQFNAILNGYLVWLVKGGRAVLSSI